MAELTRQRCCNHAFREAAAVCPGCGRFFCRECVTEHENKVLCAQCIARVETGPAGKRVPFVSTLVLFVGSVILLWCFFYYLGQLLLLLPDAFHEGTFWKNLWDSI